MTTPRHEPEQQSRAWAKLNAYGLLVSFLALLSVLDINHPADTDLARLAGEVPAGQTWWLLGLGVGGVLLVFGFLRVDRIAETAGLGILTLSLVAQAVTAAALLGWTHYTLTRLAVLAAVAFCTWARVSVLWSRDGLAVTIPPRGLSRRRR